MIFVFVRLLPSGHRIDEKRQRIHHLEHNNDGPSLHWFNAQSSFLTLLTTFSMTKDLAVEVEVNRSIDRLIEEVHRDLSGGNDHDHDGKESRVGL